MTHTANTVCPNRTHTNYMYINVILRRLSGLHINHQIYLNIYLQNGLFIVKKKSIHFFTLEFKSFPVKLFFLIFMSFKMDQDHQALTT